MEGSKVEADAMRTTLFCEIPCGAFFTMHLGEAAISRTVFNHHSIPVYPSVTELLKWQMKQGWSIEKITRISWNKWKENDQLPQLLTPWCQFQKARCEISTPFGWPVEPLVNHLEVKQQCIDKNVAKRIPQFRQDACRPLSRAQAASSLFLDPCSTREARLGSNQWLQSHQMLHSHGKHYLSPMLPVISWVKHADFARRRSLVHGHRNNFKTTNAVRCGISTS